jgi:ABC-type uncharacterized transport system auxiliary subunit
MRAACLAAALLATGCVFRNAPEPRFFRPESAALDGRSVASLVRPTPAVSPEAVASSGVPLRLRPVRGTPLLRERIVWRASPVEYGLYEQRRWSELPASYVERALESALRDTPGIRLTDEPRAAALGVEVVAFDEVLAPARAAAVSLEVELLDTTGRRILDRTFSAETPIEDETPAATARAMGSALDEAVAAVAAVAGAALEGR